MKLFLPLAMLLLSLNGLVAQNTGAVFGPGVTEGHSSAQYRATFDPDSDGFAQRIHYQQSLNGGSDVACGRRDTENRRLGF